MAVTLGRQPLSIPTNGLVLHLDAGNTASYPGSGTTWYDISGKGNHFTILASAYNSSGPKYMDFNGSYGQAKAAAGIDVQFSNQNATTEVTYICWTRVKNSTAEWRTLTRALSHGSNHQVIIQSGGWDIGMYDNTNGTGFNGTGYSQQSLPGYGTTAWNMLVWRFYNYPNYYRFSYNDSPGTIRGAIASINSSMRGGICSLGGYNNANQTDPSVGSQYWGDIGMFAAYNRALTDAEVLRCYNAGANRFMGAAAQYEDIVVFSDNSVQTTAYNTSNDVGVLLNTASYTAAGTYTWSKPAGTTKVFVQVQGGGGGAASYCESGGAGGYAEKVIDVTDISTVTVTVGGGGVAVGYYAAAGDGGTSSFGSYVSASGGYGANRNASHTGGIGGIGSSGDLNIRGGTGTGHGNTGGREAVGKGSASFFGGGQKASHSTNSPVGHSAPGAGGVGGAMQAWVGSAGAPGAVIVYSYS